jgi:hypothetical protein
MYPRYLFLLAGFAILITVKGAMVLGALVATVAFPRRSVAVAQVIGVGSMALLIAASAVSVGRVYRYPKQDFSGALQFVESARRGAERVLTAGAAAWPIQRYYAKEWPQIKDKGQLDLMAGSQGRVWLLYAFPGYIDDESPGLMDEIRRRFRTVRVFPGTLSHGEVYVCVQDVAEAASL